MSTSRREMPRDAAPVCRIAGRDRHNSQDACINICRTRSRETTNACFHGQAYRARRQPRPQGGRDQSGNMYGAARFRDWTRGPPPRTLPGPSVVSSTQRRRSRLKVLHASQKELLRQDGDQRCVGQPHKRLIEISPRVADTSVGLIQRAHHRSLGPRAGVLCKQYSFPLASISRMSYS